MRGRCPISPKKRAPRNAKNKRGRGFECPVELDEEYEVDIVERSPNGEGVARIKGYLIFVGNAKPGDHVKVKITRLDSVSADATIVT
jgi:predicted RNA-binding protein with TRAM domain